MNGLLRWGLLTGLMIAAPSLSAADANSPWSVHVWQSDDGLPNNNVTGITQTGDGYLWIANPGNLARFDGVHFDELASHRIDSQLTQRAAALASDHKGTLWLAMDHGAVAHLDGGTPRIYTNDLPNQLALTVMEDAAGGMWIVYRSGFVCRIKNDQVRRFSPEDLPNGYGLSLANDSHGRLWFARLGQLGVFEEERFQVRFRLDRVPTLIAKASAGGLWACVGNRLLKCDETGIVKDCGRFNAQNAEPTALLEGTDGDVWIGTADSGLFRFNGSAFENVPLSHREILCLFNDPEGNLWVGTGGGGLNRVSPRAVQLQGTESGLPFEAMQSLTEDTNGVIWATTQTGSLVCRTNGRWETITLAARPRARASCVAADASNVLWIGTYNYELLRIQGDQFEAWTRTAGLQGHTIHALLPSRSGDVWMGEESPDIVQRLHNGKIETFAVPPGPRMIRAIAEDTAGNIWIGTSKGLLLRITDGKLVDETARLGKTLLSIRTLMTTPDGSLWLGFAGFGVGRLKDGKFAQISVERGLFDYNISQMVADGRGWMWCGADHGIFRVRQKDLDWVADGRGARVGCIHYGRDEGLPSLQANFGDAPGALRSRDGRLWIPTRTALAVVEPNEIREYPHPPQVRLERVIVDDKVVARYTGVLPVFDALDLQNPRNLRLSPGHHRLEFNFTALSFSAPENVHFRYRLDGFDEQWLEAGTQRAATYSRLPAGEYRFLVTACNSDGVWSERNATLAFVVAPFFWQTWLFRIAALGLVIGLVRYASFRRLRSRLERLEQQAALYKERARIAKDLHDDLGTRLTKIVLLTGIARREAASDIAEEHLDKISDMSRQVIKSLDETVWAVNPRNDTLPHLVSYIAQFAVEFLHTAEIRCAVNLPEHPPDRTVPATVRHNLFLAVKEALNNVVRHSNATEVRFGIVTTDESIEVTIDDNGRGFGDKPDNGEADGLRNMRQRMAEVEGRCEIETRPGAGTRISFACPWRNGD
jgi:signal transduction histidine kinase/ligand-binding sensor domain-containing protein